MASIELMGSQELLDEFLLETQDHLDQLETGLLRLESEPLTPSLLALLFRNIHTVKGACGFLGFRALEGLAHAGEDLLHLVRDGKLSLESERIAALLSVVDAARQSIARIATTGTEARTDYGVLIDRLRRLRQEGPALLSATPPPDVQDEREPAHSVEPGDKKIRVDVGLLDRLMNLVGELVLARNQLLQGATAGSSQAEQSSTTHRLNLIITQLQEVVMKTRLQPISLVWNRFPRLVRDLALGSGKHVQLLLRGEDTELDKTLLEALREPLTHLLRNAIDHGLETPAQRASLGKPTTGTLTLRAWHAGGMVNLELSDDGAGIDPQRLRQRAVALGLLTAEQSSRLGDREALALIFRPGFSTATQVTALSGRGVGMDAVKAGIEKIGGAVSVSSQPGQGTQVLLKIPLTLAIIPSLIVTCRTERYAIPQASLLEVIKPHEELARSQLHFLQGAPVLELRGRLIPLAWLSHELGLASGAVALEEGSHIVLLQAGERTFGLVVDAIHDTEEIVVKPLWKKLKSIACYSGATVLGDGRVALILDAVGLGQRLGVVTERRELAVEPEASAPERGSERVLVCRNGADGQLAIPLARVSRLETLDGARVERLGGMEVLQYRGRLLPLARVASALSERRRFPRAPAPRPVSTDGMLPVVICAYGGSSVGLVVDAILDVAEVKVELQQHSRRPCILGSMVVQERATEFLDVDALVREVLPSLSDNPSAVSGGSL